MPALTNRPAETAALAAFLASAAEHPAALVVEGEPGIGKSTLWLDGVQRAPERGFRVLAARTAAVESGLAYASLADLLRGVEVAVLDQLPEPQKVATDSILSRASAHDGMTDQRAVSAAVLSIIELLRETSPVLIAIDDLQWLDPSSRRVLEFVARRLAAGVGMLCTLRTDTDRRADPASWLQLPEPDAVGRIRLGPLSVGALHTIVAERLGRSLPRPAMVRIFETSGGNPFYAIELARAIGDHEPGRYVSLPATLSEVVRARVGALDGDLQHALLAMACLNSATTDDVVQAAGLDYDRLMELLEQAEAHGVIEIDGSRLHFAHPLLARGVYDAATPAQRRKMHHRLAQIVNQPELRARHRALGTTRADPATLEALDAAAEAARSRGASSAAAELLELAIRLGGDTAERRIQTAACHFNAGDAARARNLLQQTIEGPVAGTTRAHALNLLAVMSQVEDSLLDSADQFERALAEVPDDLALRVQMLVSLAWVQIRIGRHGASKQTITAAVTGAQRLGQSALLSQALGMSAVVRVLLGDGLDERNLWHSLTLIEEPEAPIPATLHPAFLSAMALAWTGELEAAHDRFVAVRRRCIERGEESELVFVSFHSVLNEIWRTDLVHAMLIAEDACERAQHLTGELQLSAALTARAIVAAYAGRENDARRDIGAAIGPILRSGAQLLAGWTVATLGFLEISLGNYQAAAAALEPLLGRIMTAPQATEIFTAGFLPDAAEAMINLGRHDDAEPLIDALERNGRRLDRPWMLAVGARCRSMMLAARGDVEAALACAQQAMVEHDRLPMPFERARTQLLVGQLHRRQRHNESASAAITDALRTFDEVGTGLWAHKARAELARANVGPRQAAALTVSEQRVAELAATGMTNRNVAAALFISPKTVEANLIRIYRKLGIHSRAELGRRIGELNT